MAKYTDIGLLQKHLNIDFLEIGDSEYLDLLLAASESRLETELKQPFSKFVDEDGKLNPALVEAILLFSGTLYANREAVAYSNPVKVPFSIGDLIQPYIKYG